MAKNINLNKGVFNKRDYQKTINTSFTQLDVPSTQEQLTQQTTVSEFFNLYNELFYEINEIGETNSHEYLIKTSSQYINFNENDELIQALQNEIAQLREELLETQQQLVIDVSSTQTTNTISNNTTSVSSGTSGVSGGSSGGGGGGY